MKKFIAPITALFLGFWIQHPVSAQTADEIVAKYVEVIGGVDAWKAKKTMKMTGVAENFGMTFPITVYAMRPNLQKVEVEVQGQKFVEAFDGTVAWTINPFMGGTDPVKKSEEESKEAAKQMFEDDLVDYQSKGHRISFEGEEEMDGAKTYKIKLTRKDGDELIYFIDAETYVPVVVRRFISVGELKGKAVDVYMSDYTEVEDVVIPLSMEQKVDGQTFMKSTMKQVEFNVPLTEADFAFPGK